MKKEMEDEEGKELIIEAMAMAADKFQEDCMKMAEENWCQSQVKMLERLFDCVLKGERYGDEPEEE